MGPIDSTRLFLTEAATVVRYAVGRFTPAELFAILIVTGDLLYGLLAGDWLVAVLAIAYGLFLQPIIADRLDATGLANLRAKQLQDLLATRETGAPRIVEVPCQCGRENRYLYGPVGWENAGPAEHQPNRRPI